jgi:hypothetical protein
MSQGYKRINENKNDIHEYFEIFQTKRNVQYI